MARYIVDRRQLIIHDEQGGPCGEGCWLALDFEPDELGEAEEDELDMLIANEGYRMCSRCCPDRQS